jgi:hypothetical protein
MADSCEIVSLSTATADPAPDTTCKRLSAALDLLLAGATPARAERALRVAIFTLVNPQRAFLPTDDSPVRDLLTPVPRPPAPELERWPEMRQQLRAIYLPAGQKRRAAIAAELLLAPDTLLNALSRTDVSGKFAKRLAVWLDKGGAQKPNEDGHRHPRTYELSKEQRDRLRLLLNHIPNAEFRRAAGVAMDIAISAADGAALPPDIVTRLVHFLDGEKDEAK